MKISDNELRTMVREAIQKKLASLKEARDFSARRQVVHSAQQASMEFENEIVGLLNVVKPDELPPALQKQYYFIVEQMKDKIVSAVMEATRELARLPKNENREQKKGK